MSTSASKSQANQTSTQTSADNRNAVDNGGIALSGGSSLVMQSVDQQTIDRSFDFGEKALAVGKEVSTNANDNVADTAAKALTFASEIVDTAAGLQERQISQTADTIKTNSDLATSLATVVAANLTKNAADPNADTVQTVAKYAAIGAAVIGAAMILKS